MLIDKIQRHSPNHDARVNPIALIVLHYTGMETGEAAIERLCDPVAGVSAHYVVEEDGRVFSLVPEDRRAWHAGLGGWGPHDNVNDVSIGVEIVNPGHYWGYKDFPDAQIVAVKALVKEMMSRHHIKVSGVVGHSDVAPERKDDPGEWFPWGELAAEGLLIGPYSGGIAQDCPDYESAIRMLQDIGYRVKITHPVAVTLAFQRRFCPADLGRGLSPLTRSAIAAVHRQFTTF